MIIKTGALVFGLLVLAGCGAGSGAANTGADGAFSPAVITGVVTKGPLKFGQVAIFRLNDDLTTGEFMGLGKTDENGNFSITLLAPSVGKPLVLFAQGGTYKNPLTNESIPLNSELVAFAPGDQTQSISLSSLSFLAAARAHFLVGTRVSVTDAITRSLQDVSGIMGVGSVLTLPKAALQNSQSASLTLLSAQSPAATLPAATADNTQAKLLLDAFDVILAQAAQVAGTNDLFTVLQDAATDFDTDGCLDSLDSTQQNVTDPMTMTQLQNETAVLKQEDVIGQYQGAVVPAINTRGIEYFCSGSQTP